MITRIEATRYRCFERLEVDLGQFQIVVGPNGSGKTTLLDIPTLFGDLLHAQSIGSVFIERLNGRPPRSTTFEEIVFAGQGDTFILAVELALPEHVIRQISENKNVKSEPLHVVQRISRKHVVERISELERARVPTHARYEVRFQVFEARGLEVQDEYLFLFPKQYSPVRGENRLHGDHKLHSSWRMVLSREYGAEAKFQREFGPRRKAESSQIDPGQLGLPRVQFESRVHFPAARWAYEFLTRDTVFFEPNWATMQQASPPGLPRRILPSGRNMPWLALELKRSNPNRYKDWVRHIREALRNVKDVDVREREDDHHAYFVVTYEGGFKVTSSGLSDGTLRVLALTLLAYLPQQSASLVTEEPECGIHPRAIEAVLQSLSSLYSTQVWVSSHSPVVLAHSKLSDVLCARLEKNGAVTIVRGTDHPRLKEWKGTIDLGALFAAGVLG